ncbi:MAG TPA: c-type cytochrome biogenesis protein CcmI [Xanthobacteraceae bacterium]|nr:c-type cytochrome biogenesis protein CcmI [Xanthobacteraceae bacterium]
MTLTLIFALMTVAAALAVLWPLRKRADAHRGGSDVEIYRDQLDEIERDQAGGRIGPSEAEAARVEVSRRLIAAMDGAQEEGRTAQPLPSPRRGAVVATALVLLPLFAGGFYYFFGSPGIPTLPLSARLDAGSSEQAKVEGMVAEVEAYLARNPDSGRGWEVLAPIYIEQGRYDDAVKARRRALEILGPDAARLGDLGEAMVLAADGIVTAEAKALFERAAALDREDVMAQYYLGLAAKQDGRRDEAEKTWRALLTRAPQGAPWIPLVERALARIDQKTVPASGAAAPEHGGSVEEMVERLAARLKQDGSNLDGWIQLVRSYRVLGQTAKATEAIAAAKVALAGDPDKLRKLDEALKDLDRIQAQPALAAGPRGQDANAAAKPPEHQGTVEQMVARLAERLKTNGSDLDGWVQLVRSYKALGETEKARVAAEDARRALTGDPEKLRRLNEALKDLDRAESKPVAAAPSAQDANAAKSAPEQQNAMVQSMVARLAERLKTDGSDLDGWVRLLRSYKVLGETEKARVATEDARRAFAGDPDKLRQLNEAIKGLDL